MSETHACCLLDVNKVLIAQMLSLWPCPYSLYSLQKCASWHPPPCPTTLFNFFPFGELSASQAAAAISLSHFLLFGTPLPSSLRNNMSVFMRVPRWPCMFNSGSAVGRIWGASMCAYLSWLLFMHPLLKGATDNAFILAAIFKILA